MNSSAVAILALLCLQPGAAYGQFTVSEARGFSMSPAPTSLERLSTAPLPISDPLYLVRNGAAGSIASDGVHYLAAWVDQRGGRTTLRAKRITSEGESWDYSGIILSEGPFRSRPIVIWNDSEYAIFWLGETLNLARVSTNAELLGIHQLPIPGNGFFPPSVAWNGVHYLVVSDAEHRLYGTLIDSDGVVLRFGIGIPGGVGQGNQTVASDGLNFLVVWTDWKPEGVEIWGGRVGSDGSTLDPAGIFFAQAEPQAIGNIDRDTTAPTVTWLGSNYLVLWTASGLHGVAVDGEGILGRHFTVADAPVQSARDGSALAVDGNALLMWNERQRSNQEFLTWSARVDAQGNVIEPPVRAGSQSNQGKVGLATNGKTVAITTAEPYDIRFASPRIPPAQLLLIDATLPLSQAWSQARESFLAIAATGQFWPLTVASGEDSLVLWMEGFSARETSIGGATLTAAMVDSSGHASEPITIAPLIQFGPPFRAATNGNGFLVAYYHLAGTQQTLHFLPLSASGVPVRAPATVDLQHAVPRGVVWDGDSYVIYFASSANISGIFAQRVSSSGELLGESRFMHGEGSHHGDAAISGSTTLLAWARYEAASKVVVSAMRFDANLDPVDTAPFRLEVDRDISAVAVEANASEFLVVTSPVFDPTQGVGLMTVPLMGAPSERVQLEQALTAAAAPRDTGFAVAWTEKTPEGHRILAGAMDGGIIRNQQVVLETNDPIVWISLEKIGRAYLLVYERYASEIEYGESHRLFVRVLTEPERRRPARSGS